MTNPNDQAKKKVVSVTGNQPDPDTKSWYEYQWKQQQQTPQRLEEAAKFLSGTISICLALFLALGKSQIENLKTNSAALIIAISFLLTSLLICLLVLFPWRYRFAGDSIQDFKRAHNRIVMFKRILLTAGLLLFLLSLSIMSYLFFR